MREIIEKRRLNSKVFDLENGKTKHVFHVSPVHFEEEGGMVEIDTTLVDNGEKISVKRAGFVLDIDKNLALKSPFEATFNGQRIGFFPRGLRWQNKEVVFQDTAGVGATKDTHRVEFLGGLGDADLVIEPIKTGVRKIVKINSKPETKDNVLEVGFEIIIPEGAEIWYQDVSTREACDVIRAELQKLNAERLLEEKAKNFKKARELGALQNQLELDLHDAMLVKWDGFTDVNFQGEYQIRSAGKKIYGRIPFVWDSAGSKQDIEITLRNRNSKLYFVKNIKAEFLESAVYPVFTDTTTSYFAGAGDGRVSADSTTSWTTVRDATTGTSNHTSSTSDLFGDQPVAGTWRIARTFLPVDTSGINDSDTIDSANLKGEFTAALSVDGTSGVAVETSQASTTSLTGNDYDNVGTTSFGTVSLANGDFSIALNASGLAIISKTGFTKIGLRHSNDFNNVSPSDRDQIEVFNSEQTGTDSDPFLEITTSASATGHINLPLMGVG